MHSGSWAPSPGRHDSTSVYGNYGGGLLPPDLDMDLNKIGQAPPHMESPFGVMASSGLFNFNITYTAIIYLSFSDFNTTYNIIPPNKTITTKEVPVIPNTYQQISATQNQPVPINVPSSSQPTNIPSSVPAPSTPGAVRHSTQRVPASSTTMLPQPSDSSSQKEVEFPPGGIKTELNSDIQC